MLKKLKIRNRLFVSFGIVLVLTVAISLSSISALNKSSKDLEEVISGVVAVDAAVKNNRIYTNTVGRYIRDIVIKGAGADVSTEKKAIQQNIELITEGLDTMERLEVLDKDAG